MSSGSIWIPRAGGASYSISDGQKALNPGPLALHVRTPSLSQSEWSTNARLRGRLCLYYKNTLLQSAAVDVGIAQSTNTKLDKPNSVDVDFVLTTNFSDLEERFAGRSVEVESSEQFPVVLSLTLNDDGSGDHRILVKNHPELAPAWTLYDPTDAINSLPVARAALKNCFFAKDSGGQVLADYGLDGANGKNKEQFLWDLLDLAVQGRTVFNKVFSGMKLEAGQIRPEWEAQLRKTLSNGGVIQIARTGSAQYVFFQQQ